MLDEIARLIRTVAFQTQLKIPGIFQEEQVKQWPVSKWEKDSSKLLFKKYFSDSKPVVAVVPLDRLMACLSNVILCYEKPLDRLKNFIKKFKKDYEVIERL